MQFLRLVLLLACTIAASLAVVRADTPVGLAVDSPPIQARSSSQIFTREFAGVPVQPEDANAALARDLADDQRYLATLARAPEDIGDPIRRCTHETVARDLAELKKIAMRIDHRRTALAQQNHWLEDAKNNLGRIATEIKQTKATADTLAQQVATLEAAKDRLLAHVREQQLAEENAAAEHNSMSLTIKKANAKAARFSKLEQHRQKAQQATKILEQLNNFKH